MQCKQIASPRRIKSFVCRNGRKTAAQEYAYENCWPLYGLKIDNKVLDSEVIFGRVAPLFLEIGFGNGQSLLALAINHPDKNFIGVETHEPGIGSLLAGIHRTGINNLRIYKGDVFDVLEKGIANQQLEGIQIFFPDPWPKRRHHARRLIRAELVALIVAKLKEAGTLHIATDWEDYAKDMMKLLTKEIKLTNSTGKNQFASRSPYRPIVTKFEKRACQERREIFELQFKKI